MAIPELNLSNRAYRRHNTYNVVRIYVRLLKNTQDINRCRNPDCENQVPQGIPGYRSDVFCSRECRHRYYHGVGKETSRCKNPACRKLIKKQSPFSNLHGYCSVGCLRQSDINLYLKSGYPLPQEDMPRTDFYKHGLMYCPVSEDEVLFLFAKLHNKLGFEYVRIIRKQYPDCIAVDKRGKIVRIEFEYISSRFKAHIKKAKECDLVICWIHDWSECPVKVIALKDVVQKQSHLTHKHKILTDF